LPNEGGIAGCAAWILGKYYVKQGVQMMGMPVQTRSGQDFQRTAGRRKQK